MSVSKPLPLPIGENTDDYLSSGPDNHHNTACADGRCGADLALNAELMPLRQGG